MGDQEVESFSGSHADLESAADHLFTSPPRPQPLAFEALSLKTPAKSVPPTPGTALQQKIESKLEQSLGSRLDIQLEQKMGIFQTKILEAMKSLREDFQKSIQKSFSQVEVDQISASASKPVPSNTVPLDPSNSMILSRALPRTITQIRPMTLGLFLVDQRNILIRLNINPGPDTCILPQRRNSPLWPDIGL